jgi:regulator of CtrA degradation
LPDDARKEKHRISLGDIGPGHSLAGSEQLPEALTNLVERSLHLHRRIMKLDAMLVAKTKSTAQSESPLTEQLDRLAQAYKVAR